MKAKTLPTAPIKPKLMKEYWLQNDLKQVGVGPFESEKQAWDSLPINRVEDAHHAGWYVGYTCHWPKEG